MSGPRRWTVLVTQTRRPSERPLPHAPRPEPPDSRVRCLACGCLLRRRWWQRGPLTPIALCRWGGPATEACNTRASAR